MGEQHRHAICAESIYDHVVPENIYPSLSSPGLVHAFLWFLRPSSPREFQIASLGMSMDIFWNHT